MLKITHFCVIYEMDEISEMQIMLFKVLLFIYWLVYEMNGLICRGRGPKKFATVIRCLHFVLDIHRFTSFIRTKVEEGE